MAAVAVTTPGTRGTSRLRTPIKTGAGSENVSLTPGVLLADRYRILRQLGRGGMGVVYEADDQRLGHRVALKFLPASLAADDSRLEQFHNEVRTARQVSHPNVCRVYDIGEVDGHLFLSMELVDGVDLAALLKGGKRFTEAEGIELAREICAGLAAVHARGIVHRDLKPANIMVTASGHAQLMDFGIALSGRQTEAGSRSEGTPAYMAPETLAGGEPSVASDIYALGLVLYEIFAGRRAIDGQTIDDLRTQHRVLVTEAPSHLNGAVNPSVRAAIVECLQPDPARRPPSAGALVTKLQVVLLDEVATTRRVVQVVSQTLFLPIVLLSLSLMWRGTTAGVAIGGAGFVLALALLLYEIRYPLAWTVGYKGHQIRFFNHPVTGEHLYIDGKLADRGRIGFDITMHGTIEAGAGAGERITARAKCSFRHISCHIVAESFVPSGQAVGA